MSENNENQRQQYVQARWQNGHPTYETLEAFVYGHLSPSDANAVSLHISTIRGPNGHDACKKCEEYYDSLGR